ncbi:MAG: DNA-binding protein [Candidatus Methylacidiphilales bacterium]
MKKSVKSKGIPLRRIRLERLKNPQHADVAVEVAFEEFAKDNDIDALLDTLRLVAKAQGGLSGLARRTSISRQTLHEVLSAEGNPRLRTFQTLLSGLGLRMSVKPLSPHSQA